MPKNLSVGLTCEGVDASESLEAKLQRNQMLLLLLADPDTNISF